MTELITPPNIFSLEFHTKFFPQLLWSRLGPKKSEESTANFPTRFSHTFEL